LLGNLEKCPLPKGPILPTFEFIKMMAMKWEAKIIKYTKIEIGKIHRPKRARVILNLLSKEKVKTILMAHNNIKHKMMLSLIYSCGLRCGELLALKPIHIDSKRNIVVLKNAKGQKDRIVPLSPKILEMRA
jgi:integrase/recombinase XerD